MFLKLYVLLRWANLRIDILTTEHMTAYIGQPIRRLSHLSTRHVFTALLTHITTPYI